MGRQGGERAQEQKRKEARSGRRRPTPTAWANQTNEWTERKHTPVSEDNDRRQVGLKRVGCRPKSKVGPGRGRARKVEGRGGDVGRDVSEPDRFGDGGNGQEESGEREEGRGKHDGVAR